MIATGRQMRGARGLLGWTRAELGKLSGISLSTLFQIEEDWVHPHDKTLSRLMVFFTNFGIEFLENEGVALRKQETRHYSGNSGYQLFLDHVYETLKNGGPIRQFNFADVRYLPFEEAFVSEHLRRMADIAGLDARVLEATCENKKAKRYCQYRRLPKIYQHMVPWFGDHVALSLLERGHKREFVTIQSKLLAQRYMEEFDIFWTLAAPPEEGAP